MQQILDSQLSPAWVGNGRGDIVATNRLGRALNAPLFDDPARPVNHARFRFLNPRAADYYRDWDATGHDTVAALRAEAGKNPYDKALTDLIGELATRSEEFRTRWAAAPATRSARRAGPAQAPARDRCSGPYPPHRRAEAAGHSYPKRREITQRDDTLTTPT
ncbi:hypothetical protein ACGFI9_31185 [Micromonospora sp. NPDC048930]|uniref:MmyB family transcriptional regulator n=1 Tax=Micromonospora sp. NPDC048930 TaxID=3364261 RepID=UPI00371DBF39